MNMNNHNNMNNNGNDIGLLWSSSPTLPQGQKIDLKIHFEIWVKLVWISINKLIQVSIEQTCSNCILPRLFPQPLVDIDLNF